MRIAHISDLHIGDINNGKKLIKVNKLISRISEEFIDHLVITGDISDNSNENDFVELRKILEHYGFYSPEKTSIIIGNHDIFGGVQYAADIIEFPQKCASTDFNEKVNSFVQNFDKLFAGSFFPNNNNFFPYLKIIDDVAFIGLNSIAKYSKIKNPMGSNGKIGKTQKTHLSTLLKHPEAKDKLKIILIHHHLYHSGEESKSSNNSLWNFIEKHTMKLRSKSKLLKLFHTHDVKLILHGHSHDMKQYSRKKIQIINSGGTFENSLGKYFIIEIRKDFFSAEEKSVLTEITELSEVNY